MGYDDRVTIERIANGYTVTMKDQKLVAAQKKARKSGNYDYVDPMKTYSFTDIAAVTKFLTGNLEKALPAVDYDSSFDDAVEEANED